MRDTPSGAIPEKLGSFYLGSVYDLEADSISGPPIHYDARDLTTHAVCVGMTGSGKTGLCIGLLEEAALDRVPAIIIDPKGDMGNLLLHFPELRARDFEPWVNVDDARRKDLSIEEYAATTAKLWSSGLSQWGITSERMRTLQSVVDYAIYTPGSESVCPINVLGDLGAPEESDAEIVRERAAGTVGALLGLVGIDADPVQSREAIFLSVLFEHFWSAGAALDLGVLVRSIQEPPVRKFGVLDVDSFFPAEERFKLAMSLNNLMASPSFGAWLAGEPLDIDSLLYLPDGTPRHSIFYIAHLSEAERMFFVTLLLNALVSWMRQQPGTTSLRALLYFDEVFGFLPPVAMPPSKRPLLTILKQARAFGLGSVLVTQNPVDLDYKALSNAGTWFIGRLQSKQDQERLMEGLRAASATDNNSEAGLAKSIGQLKSRVFLLNNVHEDRPVAFHTRWAMNYLRGPLTRAQLKLLAPAADGFAPTVEETTPRPSRSLPSLGRPVLPPGLSERFLATSKPGGEEIVYRPTIGALARTRFLQRKFDIAVDEATLHFFDPDTLTPESDWATADVVPFRDTITVETQGGASASFTGGLPAGCNTKEDARVLEDALEDWLYHNRRLSLLFSDELDLCQRPGESEAAFRGRLELTARERRDAEIDNAAEQFQDKVDRLEAKRAAVARSLSEQEEKYSARKQEELVNLGETVLGIVFGRRRRLSGVATKRRMTATARARLENLGAKDQDLRTQIAELQAEAVDEAEQITLRWDETIHNVKQLEVAPRRTDIQIDFVGVLWLPFTRETQTGALLPAYRF